MFRHLESYNIDIGMFTLDWFVSLYVFSYNPSVSPSFCRCEFVGFFCKSEVLMSGGLILVQTVARIWDLIFYEGRVSLFCVSIGILKEVEKMILKFDRMDRLYEFLKNIHRVKLNIDKIVRVRASSCSSSSSLIVDHNPYSAVRM